MRLKRAIFVWLIVVFSLFATCAFAKEYNIEQFEINHISIPSSFSACTREECDYGFSNILSANGYTHSSWTENVMIPGDLYLCGRDASGNTINVSVSDPSTEEEKKDNFKFHRLMYDYNLYDFSAKVKEKAMVKYRDSLVEEGVNKRKIMRIKWFERDELSTYTPYILGIYETEGGSYVSDWYTIYNGNIFRISQVSKYAPKKQQLSSASEIIKGIEFKSEIDYSQAKQVYRQNQRVKLPERLNVKQKRSKVLVGASLAFISVVILAAISITTAKIRKRSRSSRHSKNGRY